MKKTCLILVLFVALATNSKAQLSFGVKGSAVNAWQQYDPIVVIPGRNIKVWGFGTALTLDYRFSKLLSIGIEPSFTQKGSRCEPGWFLPALQDVVLTTHFLEMPVLLRAELPLFKSRFQVLGEAGVSGGWFAGGSRRFIYSEEPSEPTPLSMPYEPQYNRFDFGITGGLGIGYNLGFGQLYLDSRYYHGLVNMNKTAASPNRSMAYSLGWRVNV